MPKPKTLSPQAQTTPQHLASIVKSARDKMRKDKGLSGDTDRLPQLTWIMFLKFLDDAETLRQTEAELAGQAFRPAMEAPYRWRDWAAPADDLTGDDLIAFINNDEAVRPDGVRGPGLFAYLKSLRGADGGDRRDVIANVFRGTLNRMINGYILREVLTVFNQINFASSDEIHTLSALYESMLKEMRDAAGDAGEFYTPRAVVRFMVEALDPQLGDTVLDPACGTGGFLVEAYEHLHKQCASVEDLGLLQRNSIFGVEAKPLPYLLCQMNLLLRGLEYPQIAYENALAVKIGEIGDRDRVDVILTNPPFGGEEESKIRSNFPADKQTNETALLFLQLIMRKLRRGPHPPALRASPHFRQSAQGHEDSTTAKMGAPQGGRAAVVVPNGTLFGDGVAARIKEELLHEFNLHTIVRLPNGVFSPYTSIPTNLLFFEVGGPTKEIWYYEQTLPDGVKNYTKTHPMRAEEFTDCLAWWHDRTESERAWRVSVTEVLKYAPDGSLLSANLDVKNPSRAADLEHLPPAVLAESIAAKEKQILGLMDEIKRLLAKEV
jgi:type I restriction enzyme M protein